MRWRTGALSFAVVYAAATATAGETEWSGYASLEPRFFFDDPQFAGQSDAHLSPSAVLAPEFRYRTSSGDDRITVAPFVRLDPDDNRRSHADLREANWLHIADNWTFRVGVGKVFWGVTESRHLVDIINQTDLVEDIDGEDKLGQPMIQVSRWTRHGTFEAYLLPGFRERTFPARDARLSGRLEVDTDSAEYESGAENHRLDLALRWSHAFGGWDVGLSGFHGTSRDPRLAGGLDSRGRTALIPHYGVIEQLALDLQHTRGSWLWKLEAIRRLNPNVTAFVAGFEYTLFAIADTNADLGILAEYLHERAASDAPRTAFDDDLFFGVRLGVNDPDDTMVLAGAIVDAGDGGTAAFVEAQRRVGENWRVEIEARLFLNSDRFDPVLGAIRKDGFITLRAARYF